MSTTARKARKRSGEKFVRTAKEATPIFARSIFALIHDPKKGARETAKATKLRKELEARGIVETA